MTLPACNRCGQPRHPNQLWRGICKPCRAHTCTKHKPGNTTCATMCACRCSRCSQAHYRAEQRRKHLAAKGVHQTVDATGSRRRIQAMYALGWTGAHISAATGGKLSARFMWQIIGNRTRVTLETARAVSVAYSRLSMRVGPSAVTRRRALAASYVSPLAWDDGAGPFGIDNPAAHPHGTHAGRKSRGTAAAEVRHLLGTDSGDNIAKRLGYDNLDNLAKTIGYTDKQLAARLRAAKEVA